VKPFGQISPFVNARLIFLHNLVILAAIHDATTHFSERAPYSGPSTRYPFDLLCLYSLCLVVCLVLLSFWKHFTDGGRTPGVLKSPSSGFFPFAFWRILIVFLLILKHFLCLSSISFVLLPFSCVLMFSFVIYDFSSAEALVLRSGVLTHKSMYIDGIFFIPLLV
jgi:hypothetical protein